MHLKQRKYEVSELLVEKQYRKKETVKNVIKYDFCVHVKYAKKVAIKVDGFSILLAIIRSIYDIMVVFICITFRRNF